METTPTRTGSPPPHFDVHRILVPTDLSACADHALAYAVALAAAYGAQIRLLNVLTVYDPEVYGAVQDTPYAAALREHLEAFVQGQLSASVQAATARRVQVEPVLRHSLAKAPTIVKEVAAYGADLIVMGTHGRRGMDHLLLGSVAEEIVRRAPVPVLTVRSDAPAEARHIRRILATTDFSSYAEEALEVARELAQRYGAALDLLHVVEPIPFPASVAVGGRSFDDYGPALREHLLDTLAPLVQGLPRAEVHVEQGHAAHVIIGFARARRSDLVVMSTHGLSGLAHFFIGSVTERVVRAAPCPVLTVRTVPPPVAEGAAASAEHSQEVTP